MPNRKNKDTSPPYLVLKNEKEISEWLQKSLGKYLDKMNGLGNGNLHDLVIKGVERPLIGMILETTKGNQAQAADLLGINRNTLRKKIKLLGIKISKNGK